MTYGPDPTERRETHCPLPSVWSTTYLSRCEGPNPQGHERHVLVDAYPVMYRVWVEKDPAKRSVGSMNGR